MTLRPGDVDAFQDFLDIHGADPRRWPPQERAGLAPWIAQSAEAQALIARAARLEALIEASTPASPHFDASRVAALAARTAQVIPLRRKAESGRGAWRPRLRPLAALAASLILGLAFGANGLMPNGLASSRAAQSALTMDAMDIAALTADAFGLGDAP